MLVKECEPNKHQLYTFNYCTKRKKQ